MWHRITATVTHKQCHLSISGYKTVYFELTRLVCLQKNVCIHWRHSLRWARGHQSQTTINTGQCVLYFVTFQRIYLDVGLWSIRVPTQVANVDVWQRRRRRELRPRRHSPHHQPRPCCSASAFEVVIRPCYRKLPKKIAKECDSYTELLFWSIFSAVCFIYKKWGSLELKTSKTCKNKYTVSQYLANTLWNNSMNRFSVFWNHGTHFTVVVFWKLQKIVSILLLCKKQLITWMRTTPPACPTRFTASEIVTKNYILGSECHWLKSRLCDEIICNSKTPWCSLIYFWINLVCRVWLIKQDDYFWVGFDHIWSEHHFERQLGSSENRLELKT